MLKEMNQDYKIRYLGLKKVGTCTVCPTTRLYSLSVRAQGGDVTFNTLLLLVVSAKSVKVYGL